MTTVRDRLAKRLEQLIPGATFQPERLSRNYATRWDGSARWSGFGTDKHGVDRTVCSWNTMQDCAKAGGSVETDPVNGYAYWEIHAKGDARGSRPSGQGTERSHRTSDLSVSPPASTLKGCGRCLACRRGFAPILCENPSDNESK